MRSIREPNKADRKHGVVQSFASNLHVGLHRPSNEDRITVRPRLLPPPERREEYYYQHHDDPRTTVLDMTKKKKWPLCSYFGVYDGHGG